jgi:hypothetical protein
MGLFFGSLGLFNSRKGYGEILLSFKKVKKDLKEDILRAMVTLLHFVFKNKYSI